MIKQQEFVTIKQASEQLGVSPRTIRRWIADIGTSDITRGTAKRHTLEVDISALEQYRGHTAKWTDVTQRTDEAQGTKQAQIPQKPHTNSVKSERDTTDKTGGRDTVDMQDIVPKEQYDSVLESKNEIIRKQDKHIATLESQLQNEREQRKRSDILLAETLQKIPQLEAPVKQQPKRRKKFLGIF